MKSSSLKFSVLEALKDFPYVLPMVLTIGFLGKKLTLVNFLAALGVALLAAAFGSNLLITSIIFSLAAILLTYHAPEGFISTPTEISARVKKLKEGFSEKKDDEEFMNKEDEEEFMNKDDEEEGYKSLKDDEEEGFMNKVFQNISTAGYTSPGFGMGAPLVEGFEDEKKPETKSKPAPIAKKEEMAMRVK